MAFTPIVPGSINPQITLGADQAFQSTAVVNFANSPVDLSAWVSLAAKLVPQTPNPTGTDVSFGTVTANSSGVITLQTAASDLSGKMPGTAKIIIVGKPTSGDELQMMASGTAVLSQG